jgi:pimeloyl-ACP methyl ester carboxylesterase
MTTIFLHGLDSSGFGTKGQYFAEHFPEMLRPDFEGTLEERLSQARQLVAGLSELIIVGSSFGGLMGACLAQEQPETIKRLIMLAPALNVESYKPPARMITCMSILVIGSDDTVTPASVVIPAARKTFAHLEINLVDDDHLLHNTFRELDWQTLLNKK